MEVSAFHARPIAKVALQTHNAQPAIVDTIDKLMVDARYFLPTVWPLIPAPLARM